MKLPADINTTIISAFYLPENILYINIYKLYINSLAVDASSLFFTQSCPSVLDLLRYQITRFRSGHLMSEAVNCFLMQSAGRLF